VVETLIKVSDSRSRRERAKLLVDRLKETDGLASVPVLTSLQKRADWAALDDRAYWYVATLAAGPFEAKHVAAEEVHRDDAYPRELRAAAIRGAALELMRDMLACRHTPKGPKQLEAVDAMLRFIPTSDEAHTRVRVLALEALDRRLALKPDVLWARELLIAQLKGAATNAERDAAAAALARIVEPEAAIAVRDALAKLPLDELPARKMVYARAAIRLNQRAAEQVLLDRLKRSIAAKQPLETEIKSLGRIQSEESLSLLLAAAASTSTSEADRQYIAVALGRLKDERAVPVLIGWLRGDDYWLKERALSALENFNLINLPATLDELRPIFKSESQLPLKLRIGRLLAKHFSDNGIYEVVGQHLIDPAQRAEVALIIARLGSSSPMENLSEILKSPPDRRWHAAALVGLAAMSGSDALKQVNEILTDERNPLVADAAEAAGLTGDPRMLAPLAKLVRSRSKQVAMSSLLALRRRFSNVWDSPRGLAAANMQNVTPDDDEVVPLASETKSVDELSDATRDAVADAVTSVAVDTYVDGEVRQMAFAVARQLRAESYGKLLSDLADQAELEGTPLLLEVRAERRRSQAVARQP
jgi:HEAT repeat protein